MIAELITSTEFALAVVAIVLLFAVLNKGKDDSKLKHLYPPLVNSSIPFVGSAITFGQDPINFLENCFKTHGSVFSFTMFGSTCTYLIGSDASSLMFNSKNDELNAEEVYAGLTVPVFGKGVAYDIDHAEFCEQKRIGKTGLTIARFQEYASMIEEETHNYMKRLGNEGDIDLFHTFAELVIMTASRCLLGKEIRQKLDESVADLYADLDGGFTPAAWLLPGWLPLPSFRKRDVAHLKLKQIFVDIIKERRNKGETEDSDMLSTFMSSPYRNGRLMTDDQIAGMCIALLLAGQHTSSTTGTWMGLYFCDNEDIRDKAREEVVNAHVDGAEITYEQVKDFEYLDLVLKETLRLKPPIMTMMRMCKKPQQVNGYTIPAGHMICASPTVNHLIDENWDNPRAFDPSRFDPKKESEKPRGKFSYVPFGAGRHRCIGETFAYLQIKTIWATLLKEFNFSRESFPETDYTTMIHTPKESKVHYVRINNN